MRTQILLPLLVACSGPIGEGDGVVTEDEVPGPGWRATFVGSAHDVAGEVEIVDAQTIRIDPFQYDGGGANARLFLVVDGADFQPDFELTDNLVGTPFDGEALELSIPEAATPGTWDTIVLWCIPFAVEFGHATFAPPEG